MENKETFNYTYSAKEQDEIKSIRDKYTEKKEDKMEILRRLDRSVTKKATTTAMSIGIIGALVLGSGMSLVMTDLYNAFSLNNIQAMVIGIVTGILGLGILASAYPVYKKIEKKEKEKIAPEILRLSEELMK